MFFRYFHCATQNRSKRVYLEPTIYFKKDLLICLEQSCSYRIEPLGPPMPAPKEQNSSFSKSTPFLGLLSDDGTTDWKGRCFAGLQPWSQKCREIAVLFLFLSKFLFLERLKLYVQQQQIVATTNFEEKIPPSSEVKSVFVSRSSSCSICLASNRFVHDPMRRRRRIHGWVKRKEGEEGRKALQQRQKRERTKLTDLAGRIHCLKNNRN